MLPFPTLCLKMLCFQGVGGAGVRKEIEAWNRLNKLKLKPEPYLEPTVEHLGWSFFAKMVKDFH